MWRSGSDSGRWAWGGRSREGWRELLGLIGRVTRGLTGRELQGSGGREGASGFHLSPVMLTRQARATTLTPELYTDQRAIPPTGASTPTAALSDPEPVWSERPVIRWLEQTAVRGEKGPGWVDSAAWACRALKTLQRVGMFFFARNGQFARSRLRLLPPSRTPVAFFYFFHRMISPNKSERPRNNQFRISHHRPSRCAALA